MGHWYKQTEGAENKDNHSPHILLSESLQFLSLVQNKQHDQYYKILRSFSFQTSRNTSCTMWNLVTQPLLQNTSGSYDKIEQNTAE